MENLSEEAIVSEFVLSIPYKYAKLDLFWFRIENKGQFKAGIKAGVADFFFEHPSKRPMYIEFKTQKGRQSDVQKKFEARCKLVGSDYYIVRDSSSAIALFKGYYEDLV